MKVYNVFVVNGHVNSDSIFTLIKTTSSVEVATQYISSVISGIDSNELDLVHKDMKIDNNYTYIGSRDDCNDVCKSNRFGGIVIEETEVMTLVEPVSSHPNRISLEEALSLLKVHRDIETNIIAACGNYCIDNLIETKVREAFSKGETRVYVDAKVFSDTRIFGLPNNTSTGNISMFNQKVEAFIVTYYQSRFTMMAKWDQILWVLDFKI